MWCVSWGWMMVVMVDGRGVKVRGGVVSGC